MKAIARHLRAATPIAMRKTFLHAGNFFGAGLADDSRFPSVEGTLKTLRNMGLNPRFCVDVGAYHGEWATMFRSYFPESKILMIEAQEAKQARLREVSARLGHHTQLEMALLGPSDGEVVQFTEMETGSSVYAESSPYSRTTRERTTRCLDTLLSEGEYPSVDFLKLDVQGYELQILKGASKALNQATAVLMEASLVPINTGCPLISEVIAFMNSSGFRMFDFCSQIRRKDGVLWQTDLLFLRADSPIVPNPQLTPENWF